MWCWNCEHEWITDDYYTLMSDYNTDNKISKCPNCNIKPIRFYPTSSFGFAYAYMAKHPEKYHPSISNKICNDCDWPDCKSRSCVHLTPKEIN